MEHNRTHDLKTWPGPFDALWHGKKKHEVRKNDRGYVVGDLLRLREYDDARGSYTGRAILARVTYVTEAGTWGLPSDICVMSVDHIASIRQYAIGCFDAAEKYEKY